MTRKILDFNSDNVESGAMALLMAAERLFAAQGLEAVSTRMIAKEAGHKNHSALQYHFGSRDGLIEAILNYRITPINQERLRRLDLLQHLPLLRLGAAHRHLPVKFIPGEQHRGLIAFSERHRFATLIVGVEQEPTRVDTLHQHHPLPHRLIGLQRSQDAGRGIRQARLNGLILPRHKLRHRILREVRAPQAT